FLPIVLLGLTALVPYAILLSHRSEMMDVGQKMVLSHAPDLFRIPELLGLAVVALIFIASSKGRINWRTPEALFAVSLALTPLAVFNHQIVTARSLQPFHYQWFIANYLALSGLVIAGALIWRGPDEARRPVRYRVAGRLVFLAIWWAAIEILAPAKVIIRDSQFTDRAAAVCQRLRQVENSDLSNRSVTTSNLDPRPLVLAADNKVAVILPT